MQSRYVVGPSLRPSISSFPTLILSTHFPGINGQVHRREGLGSAVVLGVFSGIGKSLADARPTARMLSLTKTVSYTTYFEQVAHCTLEHHGNYRMSMLRFIHMPSETVFPYNCTRLLVVVFGQQQISPRSLYAGFGLSSDRFRAQVFNPVQAFSSFRHKRNTLGPVTCSRRLHALQM